MSRRALPRRPTGNGLFWGTGVLFALVTVVLFVWLLLGFHGPRVTDGIDDVAEFVAALVASAFCAVAGVKVRSARAGWFLLSLSALAWGIGEILWTYYDLVRGVDTPFPGWPDAGFLTAVPLAVAGLLLFPGWPTKSTSARVQGLLDGVLVSASVFFVSWATILAPLFESHHDSLLQEAVSLAYPVSDVAIVSLIIVLATRPGVRNRASLGLVLAGMLAITVADSSFTCLTEVNSFGGGTALDIGWIAGYLLIALGALRALSAPEHALPVESKPTLRTVLGPYAPVVVAGAVFVWQQATNQPLRLVSDYIAFGLVVVLATRQLVVLLENLALTRRLEHRVEERTAELQYQAFHDGLTGLANRAFFNEELMAAVRRRGRSGAALAVLFVDIDGFKHVNDLYGHEVGDRVLRGVAERFTRTLRGADTVARLGGDEFAVLVEDDPVSADPAAVAQRLLDSLVRPFRVGSVRLTLRASIGIATGIGAESAEELRRNADLAMYAAKTDAKHSFAVYEPGMHSAILERMRTSMELLHGLENEEFVLHFQPIVDLAAREVEGVEALVRWEHPRRGLLGPDQFIGAAESSGLILPIGAWVIRKACVQMREIDAWSPVPLHLSVNLSRAQLADEHVVDVVAGALAASGLDPRRLTLEVTESVLMRDMSTAVVVLERLREIGVKIAIDDFGTGYSSLSVLKDLPVDTLKIDRAFVTGLAQDKESVTMAERILELASDFSLHTVAEGVEEPEQLEVLRTLGCDSVQGWIFYRALPADELSAMLRQVGSAVPAP